MTEQDQRLVDLYNALHKDNLLNLAIIQLSSTDFMYDITQCDQAITQLENMYRLLEGTDIPTDDLPQYYNRLDSMLNFVRKHKDELLSLNSVKHERTPLANKLVDTATTQLTFCKQNVV